MSGSDYVINLLLVASVLRQLRGRRLTWLGLGWPLALVVWAAFTYLHATSTDGNNAALIVLGAVVGTLLGALCGRLSRVYSDPQHRIMVRATGPAALLWVIGTGCRFAFALYAEHGGFPAIEAFDTAHRITSTQTWATCLILMALAEVLARTTFLAPKLWKTQRIDRRRSEITSPPRSPWS